MSASFIVDEASRVWFYYAKDIMIRDNFTRLKNIQINDKLLRAKEIVKANVYKAIEESQKNNLLNSYKIQTIYKKMKNDFENIKSRLSLAIKEDENEEETKIDETFKALRPKSPFKLTEMLKPNFDPEGSVEKMEFQNNEEKFKLKNFLMGKDPKDVAFYLMHSKPNDPYKLLEDAYYLPQLKNIKNKKFRIKSVRNSQEKNLSKRFEYRISSRKKMPKVNCIIQSNIIMNSPSFSRSPINDHSNNKVKMRSRYTILSNRKSKTFGPQSIQKNSDQDFSLPNIDYSEFFKL